MDIVVKSSHCSVTERFREYVDDKITRLEKLNARAIRVEVVLGSEKNPRQRDNASRVEITLHTKGPLVRAEAAAEDKIAAFDMALDKLMAQLRKAADRRRVHRGTRRPVSLAEATRDVPSTDGAAEPDDDKQVIAGVEVDGDGPMVVREKLHTAVPMGLDQALYEMELVGHDFFLFVDAETGRPSVVYRRRGYDYGVIQLETEKAADAPNPQHNGHTNGRVPTGAVAG